MARSPASVSDARIEIYKIAVEMADRVSQRRQSNNNFYLTVNTAIVGAVAYLTNESAGHAPMIFVSFAGVIICLAWVWSIQSYRGLNRAKFVVIHQLETALPAQPYTAEWDELTNTKGDRHIQFHTVEAVVPWVFGALHSANLLMATPWKTLLAFCK